MVDQKHGALFLSYSHYTHVKTVCIVQFLLLLLLSGIIFFANILHLLVWANSPCLECLGIPLCASNFVTLNSLFSSSACRSQVTFLKFFLMMLVLIIENL